MKSSCVHCFLILILALSAGSAGARNYLLRSDGSGDFPDIATALALAINGDVIELAAGVYGGAGNRDLDFGGKSFTLRSLSDDPTACIIDAEGVSRILNVVTGETEATRVEGITFRNGVVGSDDKGGAILCRGVDLNIGNCVFETCEAAQGGALFGWDSRLVLSNCIFRDNNADLGGAVACAEGSALTCVGSSFEGNTARYGGGVGLNSGAGVFEGCTFSGNVAVERGGAVYSAYYSDADFTLCTIVANQAPTGSGIAGVMTTVIALERSIIADGIAGEAVILLYSSTITASCTDITGNAGGDWTGELAALASINDNLSANPQFCLTGSEPYSLQNGSPCSEDIHACARIGAWDVGCSGLLKFRSGGITWSTIKGYYN
ncbi:MAG: hypothetical protein GY835_09865 [bacterium]|nr:hypothetical protein [bacterium]